MQLLKKTQDEQKSDGDSSTWAAAQLKQLLYADAEHKSSKLRTYWLKTYLGRDAIANGGLVCVLNKGGMRNGNKIIIMVHPIFPLYHHHHVYHALMHGLWLWCAESTSHYIQIEKSPNSRYCKQEHIIMREK